MREPSEVFQSIRSSLEENRTATATASNGTSQVSNSCAICFDQPADFLVVPCGHQCGCEDCLKAVQHTTGKCPICRVRIESIQRVFKCVGGDGSDQVHQGSRKSSVQDDV